MVVGLRRRIKRGDQSLDPMSQYADNEYLFTSESVTEGHPDKVADQISDGVLDAVLRDDPYGRVACETLVNTGLVVVSGEISTDDLRRHPGGRPRDDPQDRLRRRRSRLQRRLVRGAQRDRQAVARHRPGRRPGLRGAHRASDDDELDVAGAGDQGMMFGYATNETPSLMPLPISLAHRLAERLAAVRKAETVNYLRPDGKTQVSVRYRDGKPVEIEKLLISTQHKEGAESLIPDDLWEHVVEPVLPKDLYDAAKLRKNFLVNPTGRFVIGGPVGDAGLTGPQDHRRHLRRDGPPRRRRVQRQGPVEGRSLGAPTRRATSPRTSSRPVWPIAARSRSPTRSASRIPCRVMVETFGTEKIGARDDRRAGRRALRPAPGRVPRGAQAAPADLPEDRRLRPLRPRGPRLHVGAHRQGRGAPRSRRAQL